MLHCRLSIVDLNEWTGESINNIKTSKPTVKTSKYYKKTKTLQDRFDKRFQC